MAEVQVPFTLEDIGSELLDQLAKDIYSERALLFRELTKNAYDAYLGLPDDLLEEEGFTREILIQRPQQSDKTRKITVTDRGLGQDLKDLKGFVQIGISQKKAAVENATGFRGLGSWSIMGGGSLVRITTTKLGSPLLLRLEIKVRQIYDRLAPTVSLDEILNKAKLIQFFSETCDKKEHFTTIEIICDGPPQKVGDYELNRLWDYADPKDTTLKDALIRYCAVPFSAKGGANKKIREIYEEIDYVPTPIRLDGELLEKNLPTELSHFETRDLEVDGKVVAKAWYADNPKQSKIIPPKILNEGLLGEASIQMLRFNVPIGYKGQYKSYNRATDQWYVGEVHIVATDVLPNASGEDLRAGMARDAFVTRLRKFYDDLNDLAEIKSEALSLTKALERGVSAKKAQAAAGKPSQADQVIFDKTMLDAVNAYTKLTTKGKATPQQKTLRAAAKKPEVKLLLATFKTSCGAEIAKFTGAAPGPKVKATSSSNKVTSPTSKKNETADAPFSNEDIQERLGQAIPKLKQLKLSDDTIEVVLAIFGELFAA